MEKRLDSSLVVYCSVLAYFTLPKRVHKMVSIDEKKKNLLDLEFSSQLNSMNIILISFATLVISLWTGLPKMIPDNPTNVRLLLVITVFCMIVSMFTWRFYNSKLEYIKTEIKKI